MAHLRLPFFSHRQATGFDYLAIVGFAINMAVVLLIVIYWIKN